MRGFYFPGGFNFFGAIIVDVLAGLVFIICLAVVVALIVVLVRFLLVATKAAQIYVDKNSVDKNSVDRSSVPAPVVAPAAETAPVEFAPATKPRAPKKN